MTNTNAARAAVAQSQAPWEQPWWHASGRDLSIFIWIMLIHLTAVVGLVMYPLPGWRVLAGAIALVFIGGLGTTVGYHRALAHRSVTLHPWVRSMLIFFAMFNGSGAPTTWAAGHRLHHAKADTPEDISSPVWGGFWWAHLRWLWQAGEPPVERYCPDLGGIEYRAFRWFQPAILAVSYFGGLAFGWPAFFWLGAIRLCFGLHAQCFVNSICHTEPGIQIGEDSSRNVRWLAIVHLLQGENWHRNHHSRPGSARLGWSWREPDVGWIVIRGLELLGLASDVRAPSRDELKAARAARRAMASARLRGELDSAA
ncbi:MAG TPA: fatty acid desaturase [Candidatus Binataceae bacterium]|nr:fatty acid desaturase [Candidatus Binataceae bacterium]